MHLHNKRIMIVVAHPDDELLGLGGTMNKWINEMDIITHVVILGEGITSRSDARDVDKWEFELKQHQSNIINAQKAIGYHSFSTFNLADNRFDTIPLLEIIKIIEKEKANFLPDFIFTHHGGDVNIDHQKTFEAVMTACRPLSEEKVQAIITFETPSGTEWRASSDPKHFIPNLFVSFSRENLEAKILAMESYEFEKREFPHPRSSRALKIRAQNWGISVGVEFAEPFCIIRNVLK